MDGLTVFYRSPVHFLKSAFFHVSQGPSYFFIGPCDPVLLIWIKY